MPYSLIDMELLYLLKSNQNEPTTDAMLKTAESDEGTWSSYSITIYLVVTKKNFLYIYIYIIFISYIYIASYI